MLAPAVEAKRSNDLRGIRCIDPVEAALGDDKDAFTVCLDDVGLIHASHLHVGTRVVDAFDPT